MISVRVYIQKYSSPNRGRGCTAISTKRGVAHLRPREAWSVRGRFRSIIIHVLTLCIVANVHKEKENDKFTILIKLLKSYNYQRHASLVCGIIHQELIQVELNQLGRFRLAGDHLGQVLTIEVVIFGQSPRTKHPEGYFLKGIHLFYRNCHFAG